MAELVMITPMSGTRADGEPWPARGETITVSDAEAEELTASGIAAPKGDDRHRRSGRERPKSQEDADAAEAAGVAEADAVEAACGDAQKRTGAATSALALVAICRQYLDDDRQAFTPGKAEA